MKSLMITLLFAFIFFTINIKAQPSKSNYSKRSWYKITEGTSEQNTFFTSDNFYDSPYLNYDLNDNHFFDVKDDWGYSSRSAAPISDYIPILMVGGLLLGVLKLRKYQISEQN